MAANIGSADSADSCLRLTPLTLPRSWVDLVQRGANVAVLFLVTPFYRLLVGEHLLATGGSILAIGLLHASWNEAAKFDFVDGDWHVVAAVALLALGLVAKRRLSTRSAAEQDTVEDEREEAASWITPARAATVPSA
jgi:hypothetical protein